MHRLILPCAAPHHWYSSAQYRVKYSPQIIPKSACGQQTKAGLFRSCRKEAGLLTCRTPTQLNLEKPPNPPASAASADLLRITHCREKGRDQLTQQDWPRLPGCACSDTHHSHVLPKEPRDRAVLGERCWLNQHDLHFQHSTQRNDGVIPAELQRES